MVQSATRFFQAVLARFNRANLATSIPWNLALITAGSLIFAVGINGIIIHNNFITGGIFGAGLLVYYGTEIFSASSWYLLINLPLFVIGWFFVGRRFFLYSLYGVISITFFSATLNLNFNIQEQIYAAVAGGIICGIGSGIILRSLGSAGGLDILAVILNQRFNIGVGKVYLIFNVLLFGFTVSLYSADIVIASIIQVFISSVAVDYMLSMFNQRKIIYVISDHNETISKRFSDELRQGATFIKGRGAYTGRDKLILMAITNNLQLKKLESIVFAIDEQAMFIVENSFNVIGSNFNKRKIY